MYFNNFTLKIMEYTSKEVYEYVSKHSNDPIVEWKKCHLSWQDFPIYKSDLEFYDKVSPIFEVDEWFAKDFFKKNSDVKDYFEYKDWKLKAKIPTPTLCPEEREAQRFVFRNERFLYRGVCSFSWKTIISMFSPDKNYKVCENNLRRSDKRTPWEIWEKDILENFYSIIDKLLHIVPVWNKYWLDNENSEYSNVVDCSKDTYMCYASSEIENSLYIKDSIKCSNCMDCMYIDHCENCFDCVKTSHCFSLLHSNNCVNCSTSSYLNNCTNCHDCFNCIWLENQSYCINNIQYTKEDYQKIIKEAKKTKLEQVICWCMQQNSEKCFGNDLVDCHNCFFVWSWTESRNIKYTISDIFWEDCFDSFRWSSHCIYTIACRYSHSCWCIAFWKELKNCRYCLNTFFSSNCFGCVWLRNREYCIYNKQYTKEQYNQIVPQIIAQMIHDKEWWEFFDPQTSYYWYNETIAMDYYPLKREEALKMWYKWNDYESPMPHVEKMVQWKDLPKQWCGVIKEKKPEILEKILNYAIVCEVSNKPFRVTKQEIEFYIRHDIPLPTKHPNVRHHERFARKDPTIMKLIKCDECWEEMLSVHKPWEWKKILCEKCFYNKK